MMGRLAGFSYREVIKRLKSCIRGDIYDVMIDRRPAGGVGDASGGEGEGKRRGRRKRSKKQGQKLPKLLG